MRINTAKRHFVTNMGFKLKESHILNCKIENLQRLCQWLDPTVSTNKDRLSLLKWLVFNGFVSLPKIGWSYLDD